jgi:hypothetical protein
MKILLTQTLRDEVGFYLVAGGVDKPVEDGKKLQLTYHKQKCKVIKDETQESPNSYLPGHD